MNFLTDQDVYQVTVEFLIELGHDIITVKSLVLSRANDRDIIKKSIELDRILITRDKDFGTLVFLEKFAKLGIIFLRISPSNLLETHSELKRLLVEHSEFELKSSFCTVESDRYRIRKLDS